MAGLGQLRMESLAFGLTGKVDQGACRVHFLPTALQERATHLHRENRGWWKWQSQTATHRAISAHARDSPGRELRIKCSKPQVSHWAALRGHTLTARPQAEPRDAFAKLCLIMTLLRSRVSLSPLYRQVK